jgi:hypothetical protein
MLLALQTGFRDGTDEEMGERLLNGVQPPLPLAPSMGVGGIC